MPVLDAHHDLAHPVEGDSAWSESYYFNCYDPDVDCGFYTRVGVRPNEGTIDVGTVGVDTRWRRRSLGHRREQHEMIERRLEVGPVTYELIEPMKRWRLSCDGESHKGLPIAMDVTFDALTPAIGGDGQNKEAADSSSAATRLFVGKGHLEQAGRWSGWMEIDGARCELGIPSVRQPRQVVGTSPVGRSADVAMVLDQHRRRTHFGGIVIGTDGGDLHRGWVWRDGEHSSIAEWRVDERIGRRRGHPPPQLRHRGDKMGREHDSSRTSSGSSRCSWRSSRRRRSSTKVSLAGRTKAVPAPASANTSISSTPTVALSSRSRDPLARPQSKAFRCFFTKVRTAMCLSVSRCMSSTSKPQRVVPLTSRSSRCSRLSSFSSAFSCSSKRSVTGTHGGRDRHGGSPFSARLARCR